MVFIGNSTNEVYGVKKHKTMTYFYTDKNFKPTFGLKRVVSPVQIRSKLIWISFHPIFLKNKV
jgi:hypothetical protein